MHHTNHFRSLIVSVLAFAIAPVCCVAQHRVELAPPDQKPATEQAASLQASPNTELLIGVGDLLEVSVYGAPDFDKREVRVDSSGSVSLPLVSTVKLAGLNVQAAEQLLA